MSWVHPTLRNPKHVDLVCLGDSCQAYMRHQLTKGRDVDTVPDETWTVNRGIRLFAADLAFVLDELPAEMRKDPAYGEALKNYQNPIISTTYTHLVPQCFVFPAPEILDCIEKISGAGADPYWHNSIPMIVSYAWHIGVERLTVWGADYTLPDGRVLEDDRANLEYWIGFVRGQGMKIGAPIDSTLMNLRKTRGELRIYGLLDQTKAPGFLGRARGPS